MNAILPIRADRPARPRLAFKPKLDKIIETLIYLAQTGKNFDQYQVVKLFYLADREHFNRYGRPITFETYYALDYGPVATNALDLIKGNRFVLERAGIERLPIAIHRRDNILTLGAPSRTFDAEMFSRSDLVVLGETVEKYGAKTFKQLYNLTHDHFAYDVAWRSRVEGDSRALMFYEDLLDETPTKQARVEELELIAPNLR